MALSRELLKRLNSEDEPLPKRLKLAENIFSIVDVPLVRKEDLLLGWLCKISVTNQYAWRTLNNCLKSSHIDIKSNLKQCLIDALTQTLNNLAEDAYEEVLKCCSSIFSNNSMRQYFTNKPKDLGNLMKALLSNLIKHTESHDVMQDKNIQRSDSCELSPTECCVIMEIIESIMQIYKQSITTKDELRTVFIHDILYPLCNIIDHTYTDNTNKLGVLTYKCVQQLLLGKSKYMQNKDSIFPGLFCILSENVEILGYQNNLSTYLFILRAAIGSYKSDTTILDAIFRNLIDSSGRYKWEILNASLKMLNDVTFDFENAVEGVTLTEYFQRFITDILMCEDILYVHYEVLAQFSYMNPLLIERNIPDILNRILMEEQTVSYTNLLVALLHASAKLRREQKFISQLLISLKQHMAKKTYEINTSPFFPHEFRMKLTKSISNISSSQMFASLKTLMYYLNGDCVVLLQSNTSCKDILILKGTVELLVVLFNGMQILDYIRISSILQKFVDILHELENCLSFLINNALCLSHNKNIIIILLNAVQSLSEMQNTLKHYVPNITVSKKLSFPILDDSWQQLIQRITNFGEENCKNIMNKLILYRIKVNNPNEPIKLRNLIGGLQNSWSTILRYNTDILPFLSNKEISKVTYLLLADMTSSEKNFHEWINIFDKECFQENKCFIMYLLNHILVQIGQCLSLECTKPITEYFNIKLLLEEKDSEEHKLLEILQMMKKEILQQEWIEMENVTSSKIELYLEILLHIPIMYFNSNVRTLIFLIVYSISKECKQHNKIPALCNIIFTELLEKTGIDMFQYIEPAILINQLSQNKALIKACEISLRNVSTYAVLKNLIKNCVQNKEIMCIILECMDVVKPKLNAKQKLIFKKAEKRLSKAILNVLPTEISDILDIKCLIAILKVSIPTGNVTKTLKKLTELTLCDIFTTKEDPNSPINGILLEQGTQLAIIILRNRKTFEIQNIVIKNLWFAALKHTSEALIKSLLISTGLKEFYELLRLLYDKMINSLTQSDEVTWTNIFIIWNNIIKMDMSIKRNKLRFIAINNVFQIVQLLYIPDKFWLDLLHLSGEIISAKHLLIPDNTIDLIIMIGLKSLEKVKILCCENILALCGMLIKFKTNLITDRLPNLLLLYKGVINNIVHASKNIVDKFDEHRFRCFALDVEKLTRLLIKLKKDMIRLSPYLIADLLQMISKSTIPSYIKISLQNSICHLISICDQHGIALLSRTLPISLQEVFKIQLDTFKKFYKYSGKI